MQLSVCYHSFQIIILYRESETSQFLKPMFDVKVINELCKCQIQIKLTKDTAVLIKKKLVEFTRKEETHLGATKLSD